MITVIWIDWYSYHISRFQALLEHRALKRDVMGIELVGGCGVHAGLQFRDNERSGLPISSLLPDADWNQVGQWKLARELWRKLQALRPSSVLVPGWYTLPALTAAAWAKIHHQRSILMSETTEQDYSRTWWKESLKRGLIKLLFDYAIAGGRPHARYLLRLGLPPEKIGRYYDVVNNSFYQEQTDRARQMPELRRQAGLPEHYFLYVGRLAPEKNIAGLLRAYSLYRPLGGRWPLVLVGDGPQRPGLEQLCEDLKIREHVIFAGLKSTKETVPYYAFASCFVLPSIREPWGLVVNEAMAAGLPLLVSSACGCAEDLVQSETNGYVFDPENVHDMTARLLTMSTASETDLAQMAQKSRQIIAEYSPEHWADEVARGVLS